MHVCSVIAEFNPFHNGHEYLLTQAKKVTHADVLVVLMSGNFLQRGEPAIVDKWQRTKEALNGQADLVIELPIYVSMQAAHLFAQGAVQMASQIHSDYLVFGSEHPNLDFNVLAAEAKKISLNTSTYSQSFAGQLFSALYEKTEINLHTANDILAFNYFYANQSLTKPMALMPIKRHEADHADTTFKGMHFASSSAIRKARLAHNDVFTHFVPKQTAIDLMGQLVSWNDLWPYLKYRLLTASLAELRTIYGCSEGIEYRLKTVAPKSTSFEVFLQSLKTKRYTYTHLQRLCLAIALNLKKDQMRGQVPVYRVLGFNRKGQTYLHKLKEFDIPVLSKIGQKENAVGYQSTYQADQIYGLLTQKEQNIGRKPIISL